MRGRRTPVTRAPRCKRVGCTQNRRRPPQRTTPTSPPRPPASRRPPGPSGGRDCPDGGGRSRASCGQRACQKGSGAPLYCTRPRRVGRGKQGGTGRRGRQRPPRQRDVATEGGPPARVAATAGHASREHPLGCAAGCQAAPAGVTGRLAPPAGTAAIQRLSGRAQRVGSWGARGGDGCRKSRQWPMSGVHSPPPLPSRWSRDGHAPATVLRGTTSLAGSAPLPPGPSGKRSRAHAAAAQWTLSRGWLTVQSICTGSSAHLWHIDDQGRE